MKKIFSFALCACFLLNFMNADAKILRVGLPGQYSDLQSAVNACSIDLKKPDTIYLYPGNYNATYDRRIITIGYGYFVDTVAEGSTANGGLQVIKGNIGASITLTGGCDSSVFFGLGGLNIYPRNANTNNIQILRCNAYISFRYYGHSNWKISQSIIYVDYVYEYVLYNCFVSNCVIGDFFTYGNYSGQGITFVNNIFTGNWNSSNIPCIYKNDIFLKEGSFALEAGSTYEYNVFVADITSNKGQNNKFKVNSSSIFNGYPDQKNFSNDKRWEVKPSSVAKSAGENSTECGIFGGGDPYHLSGIPPIPAFYKLTAPSSTANSNPYNITFSVKANN